MYRIHLSSCYLDPVALPELVWPFPGLQTCICRLTVTCLPWSACIHAPSTAQALRPGMESLAVDDGGLPPDSESDAVSGRV